MRVLSLFDGISGAQQALKNLGITPETYFASEIDKHAITITMKNFPNTIQLGDVTKVNKEMIKSPIKLMTWGSPCQDLSICKKDRKGLNGEKSGLFWEALRIFKEIQPEYFMMENVASMPKEAKEVISKELGVEPILINSSLLSAQQRKRLYWAGKRNEDGTYSKIEITQPEDQHIYLKDIIESGDVDKLKSYCIDASYYTGIKRLEDGKELSRNYKQGNRIYSDLGKTPTLSTNLGGIGGPTGMFITAFSFAKKRLVFEKPEKVGNINKGGQGDRVYHVDGKSVSLNANGGGRGAKTGPYAIDKVVQVNPDKSCGNKQPSMRNRVYADYGKTCALTSFCNSLNVGIANESDFVIRKLTPLECERLQTFPDSYTEKGITEKSEVIVSNTQRYKCLGNSFTVRVIEHILSFMDLKA